MNIWDFIIVAGVAAGILLAIRRQMKKGGNPCAGCSDSCRDCCSRHAAGGK